MTDEEIIGFDAIQTAQMRDKPTPTKFRSQELKVLRMDLSPVELTIYNKIKDAYFEDQGVQSQTLIGYYGTGSLQAKRALDKLKTLGLIYFDHIQQKWWLREILFSDENKGVII